MRFALAIASLRRHRARTILAVAGVAVSAAMLLDMVMLSTGMRESFRRLLVVRGFELRLAPKGTLPFDTDATIAGADTVLRILRSDPNVARVSPVLGGSIHVASGTRIVTSVALGIDPAAQGDYTLVAGSDATEPDRLVANDDFLRATGAHVGDTLRIASGYDAGIRASAAERKMVVAGRARFLYLSAGQLATGLPIQTLRELEGASYRDRASLFMVKLVHGANVVAERERIAARVPRASVISTATAIEQVDQRLSYFRQLALILGSVSLVVGVLLVGTLVTVSVNERVGEIGVLRAIGVSRLHVVQGIVTESLAISIAGAAGGLVLGLVTARWLDTILRDFPGLPEAISFFLFQPLDAWIALGLLTLGGVVAAVYPAWRASSLPIATTLRQEAVA